MTHAFTVTALGLTSIEVTCGHWLWAGFGARLTRHVTFRTVSSLSLRFCSCKWHHDPGLRGTYGSTQAGSGKGAWCPGPNAGLSPAAPSPWRRARPEAARLSILCLASCASRRSGQSSGQQREVDGGVRGASARRET